MNIDGSQKILEDEDVTAILYNDLGFCGCIGSQEVLPIIVNVLVWCNTKGRVFFDEFVEKEFHNNPGLLYLILMLLDSADLIEHGSSIRYS